MVDAFWPAGNLCLCVCAWCPEAEAEPSVPRRYLEALDTRPEARCNIGQTCQSLKLRMHAFDRQPPSGLPFRILRVILVGFRVYMSTSCQSPYPDVPCERLES